MRYREATRSTELSIVLDQGSFVQFLKNLLIQKLGLQINDPAELLAEDLDINGMTGLWLTT
jgi:hypothetical protein